MDTHSILSSYLVRPRVSIPQRRRLRTWQVRLRLIIQTHPKLASNLILAVAAWAGLSFSYSYLMESRNLAGSPAYASLTDNATNPQDAASVFNQANLTAVAHAKALPGGPTGQLLPPGTMAPHRTYRNSYTWGQCTWYVAGRRPIPGNWGNARTWYYHAVASGYKAGTVPAVAAIAWTSSGYYGHVALVEAISPDYKSVYISEMNYRGVGVKSTRWVSASSFKYIY
jgi:surface antigen